VDELMEALRARDRAAAVVAHDLRTPLDLIAHAAELVLRTTAEPQTRRHAERIINAFRRASDLVADLLDVAAIEEGKLSIDKRQVDVSRVILAVVESQQALAANSSIVLSLDLSPDLPLLPADERRIHEVLENLIANALKFTAPGGSVSVGSNWQSGEAVIWVRDTGSGIAEADVPHLFDRFWQARKSDRRGTGLGLAICKGIVEAHGGRIWVESTLGRGTTVFFSLPAPTAPVMEAPASSATILLVDDVPENLVALRAILERSDYRILTAGSGIEALRIALREPLSVALVDVTMPDMNGLELALQLKTLDRARDVPILFVTALEGAQDEIRQAYDAGAADYLVKPLDPEIVKRKVAVFVNLSRRRG
jgi:CheY-like chemotaxis protein/two-component sensor histidine kinase